MTRSIVLVSSPMAINEPEPYVSHLRARGYDVVLRRPEGQELHEEQLCEYSPDLVAIYAADDHVTRRVIDENPRLKVVCKWGVGIDSFDWPYCKERGISVRNTPGVHTQAMAEAACAYTLALYKKIFEVDRMVRDKRWDKVRSHRFEGSTIGLVALGNIGRRTARMMSGWPVNLLGYDPDPEAMPDFPGRLVGRDELFSSADCIVIMAPPKTDPRRIHTPGREPELDRVLPMIRPGALLVNVSRGAITPLAALIEGLEKGIIESAALDVYEVEPLPLESRLRTDFADRVIFGAHTAYNCEGVVEKITRGTYEMLLDELGCPLTT